MVSFCENDSSADVAVVAVVNYTGQLVVLLKLHRRTKHARLPHIRNQKPTSRQKLFRFNISTKKNLN